MRLLIVKKALVNTVLWRHSTGVAVVLDRTTGLNCFSHFAGTDEEVVCHCQPSEPSYTCNWSLGWMCAATLQGRMDDGYKNNQHSNSRGCRVYGQSYWSMITR